MHLMQKNGKEKIIVRIPGGSWMMLDDVVPEFGLWPMGRNWGSNSKRQIR